MSDVWDEIEAEDGGQPGGNPAPIQPEAATSTQETGVKSVIPEWLTYETGTKGMNYYQEHAVNFNNSKWFARILRGFDGLTHGKLKNFWFFDVGIGVYQGFTGQGKAQENDPADNVEVEDVEQN